MIRSLPPIGSVAVIGCLLPQPRFASAAIDIERIEKLRHVRLILVIENRGDVYLSLAAYYFGIRSRHRRDRAALQVDFASGVAAR